MSHILKKRQLYLLMALFVCLIFPLYEAKSSLYMQYSFFYHTHADDVDNFEYTRMNNVFFLGASFDSGQRIYFGQGVHQWTKENTTGESTPASDITLLELGPMLFGKFWPFADFTTQVISGSF
jgi:hypothetical protein